MHVVHKIGEPNVAAGARGPYHSVTKCTVQKEPNTNNKQIPIGKI